jgi:thiosulfate dehydrogenase
MNQNAKSKKPFTIILITLGILASLTILVFIFGGHKLIEQKDNSAPKSGADNFANKFPDATEPLTKKTVQRFKVPEIESIPKDRYGDSILRGKDYLEHTYMKLPQYVGAKINCTSCHLNSGMTQFAGPWIGVVARFPQYRSRSGRVDTLTDRVNDCFERSLNGIRLPEKSQEMTDIISYMTWISKGYAIGQDVEGSGMPKIILTRFPDLKTGQLVYEKKCASCHQVNGQGLYAKTGQVTIPAIWGPKSFNIGAGMARLQTAAGFVKKNMPLGQGGSLSDDEAWDVSAYFTQRDRPNFRNKLKDWPKGDRPIDARY